MYMLYPKKLPIFPDPMKSFGISPSTFYTGSKKIDFVQPKKRGLNKSSVLRKKRHLTHKNNKNKDNVICIEDSSEDDEITDYTTDDDNERNDNHELKGNHVRFKSLNYICYCCCCKIFFSFF